MGEVAFPPATLKKLSFGQQKMALYEGDVEVQVTLAETLKDKQIVNVQVQLQACNDQHCLAPETLSLAAVRPID